jgi:hypothetical protein
MLHRLGGWRTLPYCCSVRKRFVSVDSVRNQSLDPGYAGVFRQKTPDSPIPAQPHAIEPAVRPSIWRAHDSRGAGRSRCDIGRGRRRCRRYHGRGRRRVLMHIDTAGQAQKYQRKQEGNAHRTYPSVADNERGLICPDPWRVRAASVAGSGPAITTGWASLLVDCRSRIADPCRRARPGEPIADVDPARPRRLGRAAVVGTAHGADRHPAWLRHRSAPLARPAPAPRRQGQLLPPPPAWLGGNSQMPGLCEWVP